ncbi:MULTISPECIES: hypothetical protein [unclassified Streptomyces]|uniref:hypothetical protein n=1 Tax=unclassified Streptomyces TaxID=2593676 RepID=UPI002E759E3E|nr:hypothetical protein [Streptomyces sp. JV190]MEE1842962.1 hypothetical protein [Streptomyces sp. JV190]
MIFMLMGFSLRKNWLGVTDWISGGYITPTPSTHHLSLPWRFARGFGVLLIAFGIFMAVVFLWGVVRDAGGL